MSQVSGRFFEKKLRKKLFVLGLRAFSTAREAEQKSFFGYFFFKKSNFFLPFTWLPS